jgi:DNA adenine methylase
MYPQLIQSNLIKSPLNYIGGKQKLLTQLLPLFPNKINTFVDLFAGGCNVGINIKADTIIFNDNLSYLIELYRALQANSFATILTYIESKIEYYQLSLHNEQGYQQLRNEYNQHKNPLDLLLLIAFSFNHQIRFNNAHQFNNPFGKARSHFNQTMKQNLLLFHQVLQKNTIHFSCQDFACFNFDALTKNDFVYADPPYLITTGTYNDGKRGFSGWSEKEENQLLHILTELNSRQIKFALSNVIKHKGKDNVLLQHWLKNYNVHYIINNYRNANYQTKMKETETLEVLITNY